MEKTLTEFFVEIPISKIPGPVMPEYFLDQYENNAWKPKSYLGKTQGFIYTEQEHQNVKHLVECLKILWKARKIEALTDEENQFILETNNCEIFK